MAEFVEVRCEEWLQELEEMQRLQLFTPEEVRSIAKKRRAHEYKIQARTKQLQDFVNYIKYETDVKTLLTNRRLSVGVNQKKGKLEHNITKRIYKLFQNVLSRFPQDVKLWLSFFKFCKENKYFTPASKMLGEMLQHHTNNEKLWTFASSWELEQCKSVENARQFLLKGLRHLPKSKNIYKKAFQLELEVIDMAKKELEENDDEEIVDKVAKQIVDGKLVEIFFNSAVSQINDVQFVIDLLNISEEYPHCQQIHKMIIKYLVEKYSDKEETWDKLGRCERNGMKTHDDEDDNSDGKEKSDKESVKDRLNRSIHVYYKGCTRVPTQLMWTYYIDYLIEVSEENGCLPLYRRKLLHAGLDDCLRSGMMSAKHYIFMCRQLEQGQLSSDSNLEQVLNDATLKHPTNCELWRMKLLFYISKDDYVTVRQVFGDFVDKTKCLSTEDIISVWKQMIDYTATKDREAVLDLFSKSMKLLSIETSNVMKQFYLEYVVQTDGIQAGRQLFNTSHMQTPPNDDLYRKMIDLELASSNTDDGNYVRNCFELRILHFGKVKPDLWLDYVRYENVHGEPVRINLIYDRGVRTLDAQLVDEFTTQFNLYKTN